MTVDIRPATADDVAALQRVAERAWHDAHAPIIGTETTEEFLAEHYDAETFRAVIDDESRLLAVADASEGIVGFTGGGPDDDSPATFHLSRIYVDPDWWGQGVGRQLLAHLEEALREQGYEHITLGVMAENDRAIRFYESAGFDREEEFYDEAIDTTSYVYRKELAD
ncbi:N-acetyltransferase [Halobacteriales archaeon SW_7_65_23]|nr:MAG: N-acetyltransferase [Halobacteriales archaeon SW_7_65_23]